MASKPSMSFNLGLPASPNTENAEQASLVQPLYNAVRGVAYTLDVYTGNTPITQEEREEVSPVYAARVQNLCTIVIKTTIDVKAGQAVNWGAGTGEAAINSLALESASGMLGFTKHSAAAGEKVELIIFGFVSGFSGLTPGQILYRSTVAGGITHTASITTGSIGRAITSDTIWFWGTRE